MNYSLRMSDRVRFGFVARVTVASTLGAAQVTQLVRSIEADLAKQSHFIYRVVVVLYAEDHSAPGLST